MNTPTDPLEEQLENIKKKVNAHLEWLGKFLETDSDDFTGMHTTRGIPDDGFYSGFYDINGEVDKLLALINTREQQAVDKAMQKFGLKRGKKYDIKKSDKVIVITATLNKEITNELPLRIRSRE